MEVLSFSIPPHLIPEKEKQAAGVNLITGEKIEISGYDFNIGMTIAANGSMTHLVFSDVDEDYVTKDIAILCLESRTFKVLETEGECERIDMDGTYFISDNKIAVFSYLPEDDEHFYLSLYTFKDFVTVDDEHAQNG